MLKKIFAYRTLLFIVVLVNSGCFFLTDDKKAGIPYVRELFLLGILAATVMLFATWSWVYQSRTSLWILSLGLVLPLLSAFLAQLNFGQPLLYGLLEERRLFFYLLFFPMLFLMIKAAPSQQQLERYVMFSAVLCATIGFLYYFHIIPDNEAVSFNRDEIDLGNNPMRPDRYRIGSSFVTLAAFVLLYGMKERVTVAKLALLLYFTAYLWLVMQTRSTMLTWAIAGIWVFRNRFDSLLKLGVLGSVAAVGSYMLFPEFYELQYEKMLLLFYEATETPGVRDRTIAIILREIAANDYFGKGALSLQWQDGFARIYNPNFYLSDVGLFGLYYRFGFITPVIVAVFYVMLFWVMFRCRNKEHLLAALQLKLVLNLVNFVLSSGITYGGDMIGMAAAIFIYYARVEALARAPRPVDARTLKPARAGSG